MSFQTGSICKIERSTDKSSNERQKYEIKIIESTASDFKGKSSDPNDNSMFYGETRTDAAFKNNILSMKQNQQETKYCAFYIGREVPTGLIRWTGWWIDTNGQRGDFQFLYEGP